MIRRWLAERRFQKECPHPPELTRGELFDWGRNKRFWCIRCDKRWFLY